MKSKFGRNLSITIFGGSHEPHIGVIIQGLEKEFEKGFSVDMNHMRTMLKRRAPGNSPYTTPRAEEDTPILTSESPLTYIIENTNVRKKDYQNLKNVPRPGHGDYTGRVKYGDSVSLSGGGPFSGRMTAALVIAGSIAIQWLKEKKGITISSHISSIKGERGEAMEHVLKKAMKQGDSVGAIVQVTAKNCPMGIGGAMYNGVESYISPIVFGIPGVKGLSFGNGFQSTYLYGSENNDAFILREGKVTLETNRCGGILGGITTGTDIVAHIAFKPTPSISKEQFSVDLEKKKAVKLSVEGRHDPCIALRGRIAAESAVALGLLDALLEEENE